MRPVPAIVEAAFDLDKHTRSFLRDFTKYQDGERALEAHDKRGESLREEQKQRRIDLGQQLLEAKRNIKHGGWLPYLEKLGVARQRAHEWMTEAGFVDDESKCPPNGNAGHSSTRVAAGIDKRPRRRDEQPDQQPTKNDIQTTKPSAPDLSNELWRIHDRACKLAESIPHSERSQVAHQLRETARLIEEMR